MAADPRILTVLFVGPKDVVEDGVFGFIPHGVPLERCLISQETYPDYRILILSDSRRIVRFILYHFNRRPCSYYNDPQDQDIDQLMRSVDLTIYFMEASAYNGSIFVKNPWYRSEVSPRVKIVMTESYDERVRRCGIITIDTPFENRNNFPYKYHMVNYTSQSIDFGINPNLARGSWSSELFRWLSPILDELEITI